MSGPQWNSIRRPSSASQHLMRISHGGIHSPSGPISANYDSPGSSKAFAQFSFSKSSILSRISSLSVGGPEESFEGCEVEAFHPSTGESLGVALALEQLSVQTFSHVYKGYFSQGPLQGQLTAIKFLTTGFAQTSPKAQEVLDRLYEREVKSLTQVQHPNVVELMAVGHVYPNSTASPSIHVGPGTSWKRAVMLQWMPGGDARTLIDQAMRPMDEVAAASIILFIARALDACHRAGFVHRDVKAGNILLAPGIGQVCLADWGISVPVSESMAKQSTAARTPGTVGTEFWCAPEIERGLPHDQSSDIFSLGITFLELITGQDPKYDNSSVGVCSLGAPDTGFLPESISEEARSWVAPCLALNPKERPSISTLLAHPYFAEAAKQVDEQMREMERSSHASSELQINHQFDDAAQSPEQQPQQPKHSMSGAFPITTAKRGRPKKRGGFCSCFGGGASRSPSPQSSEKGNEDLEVHAAASSKASSKCGEAKDIFIPPPLDGELIQNGHASPKYRRRSGSLNGSSPGSSMSSKSRAHRQQHELQIQSTKQATATLSSLGAGGQQQPKVATSMNQEPSGNNKGVRDTDRNEGNDGAEQAGCSNADKRDSRREGSGSGAEEEEERRKRSEGASGSGRRGSDEGGSEERGHADHVKQRYTGHRNSQTVKGVSFYGAQHEYVISGSDCGHIFVWRKQGGALLKIMKGDEWVVNCLEPHPFQPLVLATSGIENSIKIWSPTAEEPQAQDVEALNRVVDDNNARRTRAARRVVIPPGMLLELLTGRMEARARSRRREAAAEAENSDAEGSSGESEEEGQNLAEGVMMARLRRLLLQRQNEDSDQDQGDDDSDEDVPVWARGSSTGGSGSGSSSAQGSEEESESEEGGNNAEDSEDTQNINRMGGSRGREEGASGSARGEDAGTDAYSPDEGGAAAKRVKRA